MLYQAAGLYGRIFARKIFYKWNKLLFHCSLRGLGILNFERSGEDDFLQNFLADKSDALIFDVGANRGNYVRKILKYRPAARIFAFEPHPGNFIDLQKTASENVRVFNLGLGESESVLQLYDYAGAGGSTHASVYKEVIEGLYRAEAEAVEIPIRTVDQIVEEQGITTIDLLKIDTEGHELSVISGARKSLAEGKIRAVHFEFNAMNIAARTFFEDFRRLLPGYDFYRMLPSGLLPLPAYEPIYYELFAYQNIVALPRKKH